jgi:hypothetical protein
MSEDRQHPRVSYSGLVFVSWQNFHGERNHVLGRCRDISEHGLGVELNKRIPVGAFIKVSASSLNLDCSAIVRHASLSAGRYVLGLELSKPLDPEILNDLSETQVLAAATA